MMSDGKDTLAATSSPWPALPAAAGLVTATEGSSDGADDALMRSYLDTWLSTDAHTTPGRVNAQTRVPSGVLPDSFMESSLANQPWSAHVQRVVQWLCNKRPTEHNGMHIAQLALHHVMSEVPPGFSAQVSGSLSVTQQTAVAGQQQLVQPAHILLMFHRHANVRVWARETLLWIICAASQALPPASCEMDTHEYRMKALWYIAMQVLGIFKLLLAKPLPLLEQGRKPTVRDRHTSMEQLKLAAEGVYHAMVVLVVLDQRLTAAVVACQSSGTAAQGSSGCPHQVTALLLGGTLLLTWLVKSHNEVARLVAESRRTASFRPTSTFEQQTADSRGGNNSSSSNSNDDETLTMKHITDVINTLFRADRTLNPMSLALEVKKGLVKVLVHGILDAAKEYTAKDHLQRLRNYWLFASQLDPPPAQKKTTGTAAGGGDAPGKTAWWMLGPLLTNAQTQLNVEAAQKEAKERASPPPPQSSGGTVASHLERAALGYHVILQSFMDTLPATAASVPFHELLEGHEQLLNTLVVGGILRHQSASALQLMRLLMKADFLAFSRATTSGAREVVTKGPTASLQRVWSNYPVVLRRAVQLPAPSVSSPTSSLPCLPLVVRLLELLEVLISVPESGGWFMTLTDLADGPAPFGWQLRNFVDQVLSSLDACRPDIRRTWQGPAALSQLLSSGSSIPRLVHILHFAESAQIKKLAEALKDCFLAELSPTLHYTFASDAALHVWRNVILSQPTLRRRSSATSSPVSSLSSESFWLQLRNPKVNDTARMQGTFWLPILLSCNWDTAPAHEVAAAWWLCALEAEVVALESPERVDLLKVIQRLPTWVENSAPSSSSLAAQEILGASADEQHSDETKQQLYTVTRHLFTALLEKYTSYPPELFMSVFLHVAGCLPKDKVEADHELRDTVRKHLVRIFQFLPKDRREILSKYAPGWLMAVVNQATTTIDECLADQERRFQQFEWEEKQLAKANEQERIQAAEDAQRCRVNTLARTAEMEGQARERRAGAMAGLVAIEEQKQPVAAAATVAVKRPRDEQATTPPLRQMELFPSWQRAEAALSSNRVVPVDPYNDHAAGQVRSAQQRQRQEAVHRQVRERLYVRSEGDVVESLYRVAACTNLLETSDVDVSDIIGSSRSCFAREIPVLPELFVSKDAGSSNHQSLHDAGKLYAHSFAPHLALELRYQIAKEFEDVLSNCRQSGGHHAQKGHKAGDEDLPSRVPLSTWVPRKMLRVTHAGPHDTVVLDPTRVTVTLRPAANGGAGNHWRPVEGDVLLLVLPLATLLPKWVAHLKVRNEFTTLDDLLGRIPSAYLALGGYPQVAYTERMAGQSMVVCTYPPPASQSTQQPMMPFLHALNVGFSRGVDALYVMRVASMNPIAASIHALYASCRAPIAETLYDPTTSASISAGFYDALHKNLNREVLSSVRTRLLMQGLLNDWQVKSVAAVMYAVQPTWDRVLNAVGAPPSRGISSAWQSPSSTTTAPTLGLGVAPEILIVEGPPGTGKTQTIAVLTLNLLRMLPIGGRVLVCAPSNAAVDEVLLRVQLLQQKHLQSRQMMDDASRRAKAELLRVGVRDRVADEVLSLAPPVFLEDKVDRMTAGNNKGGSSSHHAEGDPRGMPVRQQVITSAPIVFSTLGSLSQVQRSGVRFDVVVVDEASQGTEPDVLQALLLAKKKCVLVGDSKQLQPTILCNEASRRGLRRSLLVRLLRNGHRSFLLRTQYRMHPDICAFPNRYFYKNKLLIDKSVVRRGEVVASIGSSSSHCGAVSFEDMTIAQKLAGMPRLVFVDVDSVMERGRGSSLRNPKEAAALVQFMRQLRTYLRMPPEQFANHIGIITYYRAQRDAIDQLLRREEKGFPVATVDSFQGKENDIVLISCVRTYRGKQSPPVRVAEDGGGSDGSSAEDDKRVRQVLGFLCDWHRINVSLTRAKELCVVFADRRTIEAAAALSGVKKPGSPVTTHSTADTSDEGVVEELRKADEDPFVLAEMVKHINSVMRTSKNNSNDNGKESSWSGSEDDDEVQILDPSDMIPPARALSISYSQNTSMMQQLLNAPR